MAAVVAPAVAQEVQPEKQQVKVQQNVGNEHTTSQEGKGVSEKQVQDSVLVSLKGKVLDKETKEEMPFVTIILKEKEGKQIAVSQTGIEGDFKLNFTKADLNTSKVYELEVITIGYSKYIMTFNYSELVSADKLSFKLEPSQTLIGEMVIMGYIVPVIDKETSLSRETVWKRVGNRFERVK
ncbi:MAG: carboxypeptidase-like regulatory domain-containing protein [Hymenobacteraceae bacterium]|nr:carboxypeptidase-like regulatory domain-containing protein [Hymenobacteraceae bacterium]MDX5395593.1 carboxypeptidase-like regulatory domain-containing protein [Hymenobacteraceae bacterium]MDX5511645.1 carboxypeptidase-like regulatory domain-containing protein [Hymenobacteraceae bacterium]